LKEKIVAESPDGIREHIESQGDRFNEEASKLFSLEDTSESKADQLIATGNQSTAAPTASQPINRPLLFSRIRRPPLETAVSTNSVSQIEDHDVRNNRSYSGTRKYSYRYIVRDFF
jgi:hypothetical protein